MASLNKVQLIGNLGKDPEVRYTPDGKAVVSFSMAMSDKYKNGAGEMVDRTEWMDVVAFGNVAEICKKFLTKGAKAYVEGRFSTNKWTDREGNQRTKIQVILNNLILLSPKRQGAGNPEYGDSDPQAAPKSAGRPVTPADPIDDSDIPF